MECSRSIRATGEDTTEKSGDDMNIEVEQLNKEPERFERWRIGHWIHVIDHKHEDSWWVWNPVPKEDPSHARCETKDTAIR